MSQVFKFPAALAPLFLSIQLLDAKLAFEVVDSEDTDRGSLVSLRMGNAFDQPIRNLRLWCFAFDAEGRVTGQRAGWIRSQTHDGNEGASPPVLGEGEDQLFRFFIPSGNPEVSDKPVRVEATVIRIVLEDGSNANPKKSVLSFSDLDDFGKTDSK